MYYFSKQKFLKDKDMRDADLLSYSWYNTADGFRCVPSERERGYFRCIEPGFEYMVFSRDWVKKDTVHKKSILKKIMHIFRRH